MNLKASRGSLCVRMGACFNAKVTKQNPATLLTVELGFFGVCSQIFFFFQKQVLWSSLNVAPRPCQERGGAPWAWLTGNTAWLVLSFPHRANSSGPEPLPDPSLSPGCRQPVLREPSTAQGSRLPSVLPELLQGESPAPSSRSLPAGGAASPAPRLGPVSGNGCINSLAVDGACVELFHTGPRSRSTPSIFTEHGASGGQRRRFPQDSALPSALRKCPILVSGVGGWRGC